MSIIDPAMYDRMKFVPIATVVIPSVYHVQLQWFLERNASVIRDYHVIVVSSAPESTQAFLEHYVPDCSLISISEPQGFAKTVNLGLQAATTEWIATCNDDVELTAHWLESLLTAVTEKTGGINPVILNPAGNIESAGVSILPIGKAQPKTINIPAQPFQTEALNAACVLYRRQALIDVGFFDETFGSYLEDIDVSLSMIEHGWIQLVVPVVRVTHLQHKTSDSVLGWKKTGYDARNWWLILFKHWSWSLWVQHFPGIFLERLRNLSGMMRALMAGKG